MTRSRTVPPIQSVPTPEPAATSEPTHTDIEQRAYLRYLERGRVDGCDVEDWLAAEDELRCDPEALLASA